MSEMIGIYRLADKGPVRVLSLLLALLVAGCILWDPSRFAIVPGHYAVVWVVALIWAVCSGVIHGSGLRLQTRRWQLLFNPLPGMLILLVAVFCFFFNGH